MKYKKEHFEQSFRVRFVKFYYKDSVLFSEKGNFSGEKDFIYIRLENIG